MDRSGARFGCISPRRQAKNKRSVKTPRKHRIRGIGSQCDCLELIDPLGGLGWMGMGMWRVMGGWGDEVMRGGGIVGEGERGKGDKVWRCCLYFGDL
jgi:hypothetical protein